VREIRSHGSAGGGAKLNQLSLPRSSCCPTTYLSLADVTPYHSVPGDATILVATIGEEVTMPSRVRVATNRTGQAETRCRVARGILR
jgi:hypothetical protein